MRFLSLSQPWLWAILDPVARKWIENRSWAPPMHMIGHRIALHAAKSWDDDAPGFFLRLGLDHAPGRRDSYPAGAVLGVATIERVVTEARTLGPEQARWFFGPYGWVLGDVVALPAPVQMRGAQGLRDMPPEADLAVAAQLARLDQQSRIGKEPR